jgi:signal transduction histidine kinase
LANLVANAIDAMPNGGKLRVRLRPGRHWRDASRQGVRITLADSGPGMPKHVRARIFEPFFTTKGAIGNGLGLWVTSELVRKHHGRMNLHTRTTPVHSGTAFSIFFPYQISEDGSVAA